MGENWHDKSRNMSKQNRPNSEWSWDFWYPNFVLATGKRRKRRQSFLQWVRLGPKKHIETLQMSQKRSQQVRDVLRDGLFTISRETVFDRVYILEGQVAMVLPFCWCTWCWEYGCTQSQLHRQWFQSMCRWGLINHHMNREKKRHEAIDDRPAAEVLAIMQQRVVDCHGWLLFFVVDSQMMAWIVSPKCYSDCCFQNMCFLFILWGMIQKNWPSFQLWSFVVWNHQYFFTFVIALFKTSIQ